MYHDVLPLRGPGSASLAYFSVERKDFADQLDQLADEGYTVRSLESALVNPGGRQVAVSFDDGDLGQFEQGFPELARRGMSATFFVTTGWVGRPGYASWDALRQMQAAGMSIQSHTRSHPFLSQLGPEAVADELRSSKQALDDALSQNTSSLALPNGDRPRGGLRVFQQAGYAVVATSTWGRNRVPWTEHPGVQIVRRCTVRGRPSRKEFRAIFTGNIWLGARRRLRESTLNALRAAVGPTRYAGWRRGFLDALGGRAR
jgi:peptidoglycan/xylan/chitin deacetylase (PgdA/CDA1 family)